MTKFTRTSGRYSPLRYPGGKGKLAKFVSEVVRNNGCAGGHYVEPFAGGAAVAIELLLTGRVKTIHINDFDVNVFAFWASVVEDHLALCALIENADLTLPERLRQKSILTNPESTRLERGFAFFFLNRTNRSGIINAGVIGGNSQKGEWLIDARFNKEDLVWRIKTIARQRKYITVTNQDAVELINSYAQQWNSKTLVYYDPPYYDKGKHLYTAFYRAEDHAHLAQKIRSVDTCKWLVSYDRCDEILRLYDSDISVSYSLNYSARNKTKGSEVMFTTPETKIPEMVGSCVETMSGVSLVRC